jgi:hypothetical protein
MDVFCSICGQRWDMRNPEVRRMGSDSTWECNDESACFTRKAMNDLEMEVIRDAADQGQ